MFAEYAPERGGDFANGGEFFGGGHDGRHEVFAGAGGGLDLLQRGINGGLTAGGAQIPKPVDLPALNDGVDTKDWGLDGFSADEPVYADNDLIAGFNALLILVRRVVNLGLLVTFNGFSGRSTG